MGFIIKPSKKFGFRIIEEEWTPKRRERVVPREGYAALKFNPQMTLEQARDQAKRLNKMKQHEAKQIAEAVRQKVKRDTINKVYLPNGLVSAFENELRETYIDNPDRLEHVLQHWTAVQVMLSKLSLDPPKFFDERTKFVNYYKEKRWSPDYIKKLNRMVNLWGIFYAKKTASFFQPLPRLSPLQVQKLIDLREGMNNIKTVADPLKWQDLKNAKSTFEHAGLIRHWNWMFVALWFGLRPKEVDSLKTGKTWKIEFKDKVRVLMVYQTKLTTLAKDKRWKPIPVYFDEQKEALALIESGEFKRPLNKTLKNIFDYKVETYSPRKGFTDLMLERGFSIEDISTFLGHSSIDMTWRHYKDKFTFKLPKSG